MNDALENLIEVYRSINVRNGPGAMLHDLYQMPGFQVVKFLVRKQPLGHTSNAAFQSDLVQIL
jgi:hypothetical protein